MHERVVPEPKVLRYDYRHRNIATKRWPNGTDVQKTETVYRYNRVYYSLDVYGGATPFCAAVLASLDGTSTVFES